MPFGQSGSSFVGSLGPLVGGTIGGIAGDLLEDLFKRLTDRDGGGITTQPFPPQLPGFPQFPFQPGTAPPAQLPGGPGGALAMSCGLFRGGASVSTRARPADVVCIPNPLSGEAEFFGSLGKPLVFQRDVRMAKAIPKLIRKLGGHSTSHRSKR